MTTKQTHRYSNIIDYAETLAERLSEFCERIELAGSIRRQCEVIGDIELIAIPRYSEVATDLFGATERVSELDRFLDGLLEDGHIQHAPHKRWGDRLKSFVFEAQFSERRFKVDLFIQTDPRTFAVNMMIRTGSAAFSQAMVTDVSQGGLKPDRYKVRQARVWENGQALDTPDERTIFELFGLPYVEPHERNGIPARLRAIVDGREGRKA